MPSQSPERSLADTEIPDSRRTAADDPACNTCRKVKLRCSRDRPTCSHCKKIGQHCIYETKRPKPGLKPGAIDNIHRRQDDLERRLAQSEANDRGTGHRRESLPNKPCGTDTTAQDILALLARELPKLATHPVESRSNSAKRGRVEDDDDSAQTHVGEHYDLALPAPEVLNGIVHAYFLHIHPWIPMVHQTRFLDRLRREDECQQIAIILHAMVLAAARFVPDHDASWMISSHRSRVVSTAMNCLSLENLQALIIIAFDDIGSGFTAKAWPIIASLTRSVEYAQLTQEFEPGNHRPLCQPHLLLPCTDDWTDSEERRRVFWNVFLLDRLCSVSTGWNTSLTSDDVHRRLPCDGHLWRKQEAVLTPYFGIWDKSSGCDGAEVDPITGQGNGFMTDGFMHMQPSILPASMSTVGAFAYNIEATESMSRVMSYFLQQKVDFSSMESVSAWLTRFKELDHRLALWKMLLPQRWRTNPNLTRLVPLMDPNLTTAHVTHNASTILLHQVIAYPPKHWRFCERLPSGYSAETCYSAGVEIATITTKYLSRSPSGSPIGSQYGFCLFIAANVLLIHWRYTDGDQLAPEYWSIIQSLEVMATRWSGLPAKSTGSPSLFMKYANRLRALYDPCTSHSTFQPEIMSFTYEIDPPRDPSNSAQPALTCWSMPTDAHNMPLHNAEASISLASSGNASEYVLDQDFLDLDRIISFDDGILFAAAFEPGSEIW